MKKVLIIAYYWPPSGGAGVQRWLKFVKYLPQFGYEPHVYTVEEGEYPSIDETLEKDIPNEAVVIKRPIWEPYTLFKILTGKKKSDKIQAGFISDKKKDSFIQKLSIWIRGNFLIPDPRRFWIRPSVKYLKRYLSENNIDTIISSGPPHSMHLIAMRLKKNDPKLKWIADFRDPWTDIDFYKDLRLGKRADKKHHQLEKEVLKSADEVITIGPSLAKDLGTIRGGKVEQIMNGFDSDDYPSEFCELDSNFSLVYVGSYNKDRNKHVLWEVLNTLCSENENFANDLKIRFVGPVDASLRDSLEQNGLIEIADFIPPVSHSEVVNYQMSARVLLLFINRSPNAKGILTGKVFEYFASGRPILGVGPVDGDINKVFEEVELDSIIDFDNSIEMRKRIQTLYENYKKGLDKSSVGKVNKYSRKSLTAKLVELIS